MERGNINIYIDDKLYHLSLYEAKELYYLLRDLFDPNFFPSRDRTKQKVKVIMENN